jgi:protein O-GlcNAc transferase
MSAQEAARQLFIEALDAMARADYRGAAQGLEHALALLPDRPSILVNLAAARLQLGDSTRAEQLSRRVLALDDSSLPAWLNLAESLLRQRRHNEALEACAQMLAIDPAHVDGHLTRNAVLLQSGETAAALAGSTQLVTEAADNADAWIQHAAVLRALGCGAEALAASTRACKLAPDAAHAWLGRGNALHDIHDDEGAIASYRRALSLTPSAEAWLGLGAVLHSQKKNDEALQALDEALALQAQNATVWANRAQTLFALKRLPDAINSLERSLALDADQALLPGTLLYFRQHACDWAGFDEARAQLCAAIESGSPAADPFCVLALPASAALHRQCATQYARHLHLRQQRPDPAQRVSRARIRIGYFSADFHNHATAWLMARIFELHDRERFEVFAFSFGPQTGDAMQRRLSAAFEHFEDVSALPDAALAAHSRTLGIDIAVDLKGYTTDSRPGIFAQRAAPIQVSYLGYPGSMGVDFIDYLIADAVVIPPGSEADYAEKIIRMPYSYQANDALREIAPETPARVALGLPEDGFVFCCFNNSYKITPDVFAIWMRLLGEVPSSVLWLLADNPAAVANLRAEALRAGINPLRLVFAPRCGMPEHLARQRQADLFLDTFHYNAHTTASDALWAGLPVLTCAGQNFPARVAASLLHATGLDALVANSPAHYAALALELAHTPARLQALRAQLRANAGALPLFDSERFTRHLESAFIRIRQAHTDGLAPAAFDVMP